MHGVRERVHVPPAPLRYYYSHRTRVVESGFDYSHINMFALHRFRLRTSGQPWVRKVIDIQYTHHTISNYRGFIIVEAIEW